MDIGKRLRQLREARGLSQSDVSARIGVPEDEISDVEIGQGTPTLPMLKGWATALGIDLHELFALGQEKPGSPTPSEGMPVTPRERTLLEVFRQMAAEDQSLLISLGRDMVKRQKGKRG